MKLFKITENQISSLLNILGEIPIKHEGLIKMAINIIKEFEEIKEGINEDIKD